MVMHKALRFVHVVGAAIIQDGRCLAAQRSATMPLPLKWEFPGGKIEVEEDAPSALRREIREELGIAIEVDELLGRGTSDDGGRRIVLDVYLARLTEPDDRIVLAEHVAWGWFSAGEIAGLDWAAADIPVLPALAQHLTNRSPLTAV